MSRKMYLLTLRLHNVFRTFFVALQISFPKYVYSAFSKAICYAKNAQLVTLALWKKSLTTCARKIEVENRQQYIIVVWFGARLFYHLQSQNFIFTNCIQRPPKKLLPTTHIIYKIIHKSKLPFQSRKTLTVDKIMRFHLFYQTHQKYYTPEINIKKKEQPSFPLNSIKC